MALPDGAMMPPSCEYIAAGRPNLDGKRLWITAELEDDGVVIHGEFDNADERPNDPQTIVAIGQLYGGVEDTLTEQAVTVIGGVDDRDHVERLKAAGFGGVDSTSYKSPGVERIRQAFCDRIAQCHGMVRGECWALGPQAVKEVIAQTHMQMNKESS